MEVLPDEVGCIQTVTWRVDIESVDQREVEELAERHDAFIAVSAGPVPAGADQEEDRSSLGVLDNV